VGARHDRDAAEVDVHDRAGLFLGVEPCEAARVLLSEVAADRAQLGPRPHCGDAERLERADGVDTWEDSAERVDDVLLDGV
jgi:hypothetical protein